MARLFTADAIVNRVAAEVGVTPVTDPYSSQDDTFQQLRRLLDSAGQELIEMHPWQLMVQAHSITTASTDSGIYDLPADFAYMIDQTQWDQSNNVALAGPLSAQDWTYLIGRDLVNHTIYASFRQWQGKFYIFPQPPPDGLDITFEYMSRNWALDSQNSEQPIDETKNGSDLVRYEPILIIKFLKAKFLEAKGFDSSMARSEFGYMFDSRTGRDEGAAILNAGSSLRGYPYLNPTFNLPDTNYGR